MESHPRLGQVRGEDCGGDERTTAPEAALSPPQAVGAERGQTRSAGQPTTGATPADLQSPQQGIISGTVEVPACPGGTKSARVCVPTENEGAQSRNRSRVGAA